MILLAADSIESSLDMLLMAMYVKSSVFIGLGKALGGLGTLMYVFIRVWGHLARNEEIDVPPLLRPVALACCLMFYDGVAQAVVTLSRSLSNGTETLVTSQVAEVTSLMKAKADLIEAKKKQLGTTLPALSPDGESGFLDRVFSGINGNAVAAWIDNEVSSRTSKWFDEILLSLGKAIYDAAGIVIKFLQTFFLLVMLITGPITVGLACFEWFYGGLSAWLGRIIHLILWLPLVNIVGGMLETVHIVMLKTDIAQIQNTPGDLFTTTDLTLVIFYLMGTAAYLMVPKAASWVIESSGVGQAVGSLRQGAGTMAGGAGSAVGAAGGAARGMTGSAASLGNKMWNGI